MDANLLQLLLGSRFLVGVTVFVDFENVQVPRKVIVEFGGIEYEDERRLLILDAVQKFQEYVQVMVAGKVGVLQVQEEKATRPVDKHIELFLDGRKLRYAERTR